MTSEVPLNGSELLEVDICDHSVCSEESGVFVSSGASLLGDFSGFQQCPSPEESLSDTSSPAGQPEPAAPLAAHLADPPAAESDSESPSEGLRAPRSSIVDCLLVELYETYSGGNRRGADSWDSSTEASGSDAFLGRSNSGSSFLQELQERHTRRLQVSYLAQKGEARKVTFHTDNRRNFARSTCSDPMC